MNRAQRVVILIGLLVIVAMVLYPPWSAEEPPLESRAARRVSAGYHPLFAPPGEVRIASHGALYAVVADRIDIGRLLGQCIAVAFVAFLLVLELSGRKKEWPSRIDPSVGERR